MSMVIAMRLCRKIRTAIRECTFKSSPTGRRARPLEVSAGRPCAHLTRERTAAASGAVNPRRYVRRLGGRSAQDSTVSAVRTANSPLTHVIARGQMGNDRSGVGEGGARVGPFLEQRATQAAPVVGRSAAMRLLYLLCCTAITLEAARLWAVAFLWPAADLARCRAPAANDAVCVGTTRVRAQS
jgi:hypothetical protein